MSIVEKALERLRQSDRTGTPLPPSPVETRKNDTAPMPRLPDHMVPGVDLFGGCTRTAALAPGDDDAAALAVWTVHDDRGLLGQLRTVRRESLGALEGAIGRGEAPTVMVTSALPGDGKTVMSLALARTLAAEVGRRVVLIDADLPKRHLSRLFGLGDEPGLADLLRDRANLEDVAFRVSDTPDILVIPAGTSGMVAQDDLAGAPFDRLLGALRAAGPQHLFVFDTAPVLVATETVYVGSRTDLTAFVLRANVTPRPAVDEAVRRLADSRIGLLLNDYSRGEVYDYYGYPATR